MYYNLRMVYITTPTKTVAKELGRLLLENRLAACVNILDGMESMYWWKGELVEEQECVLLVKTHYSRIKKLTTLVNKHHPYARIVNLKMVNHIREYSNTLRMNMLSLQDFSH